MELLGAGFDLLTKVIFFVSSALDSIWAFTARDRAYSSPFHPILKVSAPCHCHAVCREFLASKPLCAIWIAYFALAREKPACLTRRWLWPSKTSGHLTAAQCHSPTLQSHKCFSQPVAPGSSVYGATHYRAGLGKSCQYHATYFIGSPPAGQKERS